jgi:hypothetical protein
MVAGAAAVMPGAASGIHSLLQPSENHPAMGSPQPSWNTGNLCTTITYGGPGDVNCVSLVSASPYPLWYNFSAGQVQGGTVVVTIQGSTDCINLNFHSFYSTIVVRLLGSDYSCSSSILGPAAATAPSGVNIAVNSEGDTFNLIQNGSSFSTTLYIYGTTTYVSAVQTGSSLITTTNYIGTKPGFSVCPSGITDGRVSWSEVSYGSFNTFNTIFVDGTNVAHAPPNYAYATYPLLPPDGAGFGFSDLYGNETTQTAPVGSCSYLGT